MAQEGDVEDEADLGATRSGEDLQHPKENQPQENKAQLLPVIQIVKKIYEEDRIKNKEMSKERARQKKLQMKIDLIVGEGTQPGKPQEIQESDLEIGNELQIIDKIERKQIEKQQNIRRRLEQRALILADIGRRKPGPKPQQTNERSLQEQRKLIQNLQRNLE